MWQRAGTHEGSWGRWETKREGMIASEHLRDMSHPVSKFRIRRCQSVTEFRYPRQYSGNTQRSRDVQLAINNRSYQYQALQPCGGGDKTNCTIPDELRGRASGKTSLSLDNEPEC